MTGLRRILKDYQESGALHVLLGVQDAVGEGVFSTKSGDLLMVLTLSGPDYECLDASETDRISRRFESVLRVLDEKFRVYQYWIKREEPAVPANHYRNALVEETLTDRLTYLQGKAATLYSLETYLVIVYEGWGPAHAWRSHIAPLAERARTVLHPSLSTEKMRRSLTQSLDLAIEFLVTKVRSFAIQLSDPVTVEVLDSQRAFGFFRRLVNYAPFKAESVQLKHNNFVDYQLCGSALECHRDYLRQDDYFVKVLTLKEPPVRTFAQMLRNFAEIPGNALVVSEWRRESVIKMRRLIRSKRRHYHNSKASLLNYLNSSPQSGTPDMLVDDSAVAMVASLGACLSEMEVHGHSFGEFALTVVLYDRVEAALRHSVAQCFKVFANQDAQLTEEGANCLNAWLATLPGNADYNLRKIWLLDANYADLSFLCTLSQGRARNDHLGAEYLAVLEGSAGVPYFFNLHCKDVAHTLVLGATGSGKSFLINFLLTHLQKYDPFTYVFDLGGSYSRITERFGGSYLRISVAERPFTINPFCLPPTKENLLFLFALVKVLVQSNGYPMTADDERDLYEQIENLYSIAPDQRRLLTLSNILHRNLRGRLQKWVQGGPYAALFDNPEDNLTLSRFQTFDFEGMDKAADQLEPLLFYILHRANTIIFDPNHAGVFKAFIMDEAWRFFRHPVIKSYIVEALKTWRKKSAAMILATQSAKDLISSDMLPTVVESCPTKLFLANPDMDRDAYRNAFHLNETETERVANLIPRQQILMKQPEESKILHLNVSPKEFVLHNPQDLPGRHEASERMVLQRRNLWPGGIHEKSS